MRIEIILNLSPHCLESFEDGSPNKYTANIIADAFFTLYFTSALKNWGTMNLSLLATLATGTIVALFFLQFAVTSFRERRPRAAWYSLGIMVAVAILLIGSILWWQPPDSLLIAIVIVVLVFALLYFLPLNKPTPIVMSAVTERVDERDTTFAREEYRPGTDKYEKYYAARTQYKNIDDRLRRLPELLGPGGYYYDPERAQRIKAVFRAIQELTTQVDGEVGAGKIHRDPLTITAAIKDLVLRMGADEVGIARLNKMFIYSRVGRGPEPWGKPIDLNHRFAIVFTLEMAYDRVQQAPDLPITEESALQYLRGATLSVSLARFIRNLGYPARAHISDSNYQIMLPPVAHDAGLGELSRMGYLISRRFGARIRLGAVTTDLPLIHDSPQVFGIQDFCATCIKCARNCPSAAIPFGNKKVIRGVRKWQLNPEKCLWYWRLAGTDCGLCMRICPYSHAQALVHNIVRAGIKSSAFARRISIWGDDFLYGRKINLKRQNTISNITEDISSS